MFPDLVKYLNNLFKDVFNAFYTSLKLTIFVFYTILVALRSNESHKQKWFQDPFSLIKTKFELNSLALVTRLDDY